MSLARVIILAGQSNMEGWTRIEGAKANLSENEYAEYDDSAPNVKIAHYRNVVRQGVSPFVPVHFGQGYQDSFFGPEVGIANYLKKNDPETEYYFVKYAVGGASLGRDWLSPSAGGADNLYSKMRKYAEECFHYMTNRNITFEVTDFCFMQGETDALDDEMTASYEQNLRYLIADVRVDFLKWSKAKEIKFIDAGISQLWKNHKEINRIKEKVSQEDELNLYFDTIYEKLSYWTEPKDAVDNAHYDSLAMIKLGELFGKKILQKL